MQDKECSRHYEPVFYRKWGGTEDGCKFRKHKFFHSNLMVGTREEFEHDYHLHHMMNSYSWFSHDWCESIPAKEAVKMNKIDGKYFCGKRDGIPYKDVDRVDPKTKKCQADFVPCSKETNPENTVCVHKNQTAKCPITEMKVVAYADLKNFPNGTDWTVQPMVDKEWYFVYSKTKGDSRPLTEMTMDYKPCINPEDRSNDPNFDTKKKYYPLEKDRHSHQCKVNKIFNEKYDPRYIKLNDKFNISEGDLESENGVKKMIEKLPMHDHYVDFEDRDKNQMTFWTRQAIEWKLSCEKEDERVNLVKSIDNFKSLPKFESKSIMGLAIALLIGSFLIGLITFCAFFLGLRKRTDLVNSTCSTVIAIIFFTI